MIKNLLFLGLFLLSSITSAEITAPEVMQVEVIAFLYNQNIAEAETEFDRELAENIGNPRILNEVNQLILDQSPPENLDKAKVLEKSKPKLYKPLVASKTGNLDFFKFCAKNQLKFSNIVNKLKSDPSKYSIIYTSGWQQPIKPMQPVAITGEFTRGDWLWNLAGTVTLKQKNPLHCRTDIILSGQRPKLMLDQKDYKTVSGFRIQETRKLKKDNVDYYDHPMFGLIIGVTPVAIDLSEYKSQLQDKTYADQVPKNFVYLEDPRIIYDIAYAKKTNFLGRPANGYDKPKCIMTKQVAEALIAVQDDLKKNFPKLRLKIFDAYRPMSAVHDFMAWANADPALDSESLKKKYYPKLEKPELFELGYIMERSSHSRGSAVDLTLVECSKNDKNKCQELEMGTNFDHFSEKSHTDNPEISKIAKNNRKFLVDLMERHGFKNYSKEWWHFTLEKEPFTETYFNFPVK